MALTPDALISDPPHLHGASVDGIAHEWALGAQALRILSGKLQPGWRTLETGAGVTGPVRDTRDRSHLHRAQPRGGSTDPGILRHERDVDRTDRVRRAEFRGRPSSPRPRAARLGAARWKSLVSFGVHRLVLHGAATEGRRMAIRGRHTPLDRTVLRDFLRAESDWELVKDFPYRTAIFRKRATVLGVRNWIDQPYVVARSASTRRRERLWSLGTRSWHGVAGKLRRVLHPWHWR